MQRACARVLTRYLCYNRIIRAVLRRGVCSFLNREEQKTHVKHCAVDWYALRLDHFSGESRKTPVAVFPRIFSPFLITEKDEKLGKVEKNKETKRCTEVHHFTAYTFNGFLTMYLTLLLQFKQFAINFNISFCLKTSFYTHLKNSKLNQSR